MLQFIHASESFKRLNPHLFGLGAVETGEPQPDPAPALERSAPARDGRETRVEVCLVAHLRRPLDDDNLTGALKPLRDAIAATLGLDDADPRLRWHCLQVPTKGQEGVQVTLRLIG